MNKISSMCKIYKLLSLRKLGFLFIFFYYFSFFFFNKKNYNNLKRTKVDLTKYIEESYFTFNAAFDENGSNEEVIYFNI